MCENIKQIVNVDICKYDVEGITSVVKALHEQLDDNGATRLYQYLNSYNHEGEQIFLNFIRNHSAFMLKFIFDVLEEYELRDLLVCNATSDDGQTVIDVLANANGGIGYRHDGGDIISLESLNWVDLAQKYKQTNDINLFKNFADHIDDVDLDDFEQ